MIYVPVSPDEEIRQGDLFRCVPRTDALLEQLAVVRPDDTMAQASWLELIEESPDTTVTAVIAIKPVLAIVITQDCDAVRAPEIALCEINEFGAVEGSAKGVTSPERLVGLVTKQARVNQKWYYLPADATIGFERKMAADFRSVIRVDRAGIDAMRAAYRLARLNDTALAHFRERVGEFFRRYPYDEWYPLTTSELEVYGKKAPEPIRPYPWQS